MPSSVWIRNNQSHSSHLPLSKSQDKVDEVSTVNYSSRTGVSDENDFHGKYYVINDQSIF